VSEFTSYPAGTPSWIDLATTDPAAAKEFYGALFGWTANDAPMNDQGDMYSMMLLRGKPVAALFPMDAQQRAMGIPPHWVTYITVVDVDAATAQIEAAGGTILQPAVEVFDAGRMVVVRDPTGATFSIWQPLSHVGAALANEPGALIWNELQTNDPERAAMFYAAVFDWTTESTETPGGVYTSFVIAGKPVAGMMQIRPEWGPVPPNWGIYLAVEDCDAAVARVTELGGGVEVPPMDLGAAGRMAMVRDPQGAHFSVIAGM
jgi:predicted enzyme related to lactoylglutathione lyase